MKSTKFIVDEGRKSVSVMCGRRKIGSLRFDRCGVTDVKGVVSVSDVSDIISLLSGRNAIKASAGAIHVSGDMYVNTAKNDIWVWDESGVVSRLTDEDEIQE